MTINSDKEALERRMKQKKFNRCADRPESEPEPSPRTREAIAAQGVRDFMADKAIDDAKKVTAQSELEDLWMEIDDE
jgi:hypothetical protein